MPMDIVCSKLCVTNSGDQAVIARCEAGASDGYSILLWDLSSNGPFSETMFMPPSGEISHRAFEESCNIFSSIQRASDSDPKEMAADNLRCCSFDTNFGLNDPCYS